MKSLRNMLFPTLTIAALLAAGAAAKADPLTLTFDEPFQSSVTGETLTFDVNVANTDATDTVFLNGDSYNLGAPLVLDDSGFWNNSPFWLDPSTSSGDFELFTVFIPYGTPFGLYTGSFEILGGSDGNAQDEVGSADFNVYVTPEPSTWLLLGTGLFILGILARRKVMV